MKLRKNLTQVSTFFLYRLARILIRYPTSAIPNALPSAPCPLLYASNAVSYNGRLTTDHPPCGLLLSDPHVELSSFVSLIL